MLIKILIMRILLFGITKDIVGDSSLTILEENSLSKNLPKNVGELRNLLIDDYPEFKELSSLKIAVNKEFVDDDLEINSSDEIAIIPPVSGG